MRIVHPGRPFDANSRQGVVQQAVLVEHPQKDDTNHNRTTDGRKEESGAEKSLAANFHIDRDGQQQSYHRLNRHHEERKDGGVEQRAVKVFICQHFCKIVHPGPGTIINIKAIDVEQT